jgi:DNA mismatch repair protein MutS2
LSEGLRQEAQEDTEAPETVKPGDRVRILTLGAEGTVLAEPDEKGEVSLQAGAMKFKAKLSQLRMIQASKAAEKSTVKAKTGMMSRTVASECDVRGMNLEEALSAVELYLDEAVLAGLNEVYIIHGKGTGILRSGIQQDLRKNKHVKSFRRGVYGEGEDGVTVVTLK